MDANIDAGSLDSSSLDSADLDAALGSDFTPEGTQTPVQGTEGNTSVGESDNTSATSQPDQSQDPAWNPDGPGNLKVALQQEREARRQLQQQLETFQYQQQQMAYQQQMAEYQQQMAEMQSEIDPLDPDAHALYQHQLGQMQQAMETQLQSMKLQQADALARMVYPDYDEKINFLAAHQDVININQFLNAPNPAQAAYEFASRFQAALDPSFIDRQVQARMQEVASKLTPQRAQAPRTLGNLPAAAPNNDAPADPASIPLEKLAGMTESQREAWLLRSLGS